MQVDSGFSKLLKFVQQLHENKVAFDIQNFRYETVCIQVYVPGQHWEVEFFEDGRVDVEIYKSDGNILNEDALNDLWPMLE